MNKIQIYAVSTSTQDYSNVQIFVGEKAKQNALVSFEEEKEDHDYVGLFKINGDGNIYMGMELDGNGNVKLIDEYNSDIM